MAGSSSPSFSTLGGIFKAAAALLGSPGFCLSLGDLNSRAPITSLFLSFFFFKNVYLFIFRERGREEDPPSLPLDIQVGFSSPDWTLSDRPSVMLTQD